MYMYPCCYEIKFDWLIDCVCIGFVRNVQQSNCEQCFWFVKCTSYGLYALNMFILASRYWSKDNQVGLESLVPPQQMFECNMRRYTHLSRRTGNHTVQRLDIYLMLYQQTQHVPINDRKLSLIGRVRTFSKSVYSNPTNTLFVWFYFGGNTTLYLELI